MFTKFTEYVKYYIKEELMDKKLYHGSSYDFIEFKNKTTYFSETPKFAFEYSDQKAMDRGMDNSSILYTVNIKGNIFNINNDEDYKKLENILPENIEYSYNNFGFTREEQKQEFLLNLKGFRTIEADNSYGNLSEGDEFPNPEYKNETFIVYKKDEDYIYYYLKNTFDDYVDKKIKYYQPIINFIKQYIKEFYPSIKYINDDDIKACIYSFKNNSNIYEFNKPEKEKLEEYSKLNKDYEKFIIDSIVEKGYIYKINLKNEIVELKETWRFYENPTVVDCIKKLGYCGYVALEDGVNTYAIFDPKKSVEIIDKK